MAAATWKVEVSWNNDADFADTGEDVTARVLSEPGVVFERGRDQVRSLAPPMAGRCEFQLNNASKDYSVEYASGPLYGLLLPGRPVRVRTTAPSAATLWAGHLDDIQQEPFLRGGGRVRLPALGRLARLKGTKVTTAFHLGDGLTTSAAVAAVLEAAGLTTSEYTLLDTGQTTLDAFWCNDDDAFDMLRRLLAAEGPGAAIYEQADGKVAFHSRHYRLLTARSNSSQATFGNAAAEPKHSPPFAYQPNLKDIVNSATLTRSSLAEGATYEDLIVVSFDPVTVTSGNTHQVTITLPRPAHGVVPVGRTQPGQAYSAAVDTTTGHTFVVTLTALSAITVFTGAELEGYFYESTDERVAHRADTSASQAKYGVRGVPSAFDPWPYIARSAAQDLADSVVVAYQEPRATVALTVTNANTTRLAQQLAREISDRVTVVEDQTGLSGAMHIERIRHEVRAGGRFHRTTFGCERVGAHDDYLVFDTDNFDGERFGF